MQGHPTLVIALSPGNLSPTQATSALDFDSLGTRTHSSLNRTFHGTSERDSLTKLMRNVLRNEIRVHFRTLYLLDVNGDFRVSERCEFFAQLIDLGSTLADHNARPGSTKRDDNLAGLPFNLDISQRSMG
jgi:hypothetical protein